MHALVRFSHLAAGGVFTTTELHPYVLQALGRSIGQYKLGSLRYDLSKLRIKGLVEKIPQSRRYQLTAQGYRLCVAYLKLFEKFYSPLTSAILKPFPGDAQLPQQKLTALDQLYVGVKTALDRLADHVGLQVAA